MIEKFELCTTKDGFAEHQRRVDICKNLIIIVSPFAGDDNEANKQYARECLDHALRNGEYPFASHLLYPQVLDDVDDEQRAVGMAAGHAWMSVASVVAVYADRGISQGMMDDIEKANELGKRVEFRRLR